MQALAAPCSAEPEEMTFMRPRLEQEKRKSPRYAYPKTVRYTAATGNAQEDSHRGVVTNISRTGIGLYVYMILPEGEMITFQSELPVEPRHAMVKWSKEVSKDLYQAGLEFTN